MIGLPNRAVNRFSIGQPPKNSDLINRQIIWIISSKIHYFGPNSRGVEWCFFDQAGMGVKSFFLAFNLSMDMS